MSKNRAIKLRVWDAARQCFTPLASLDQLSDTANLSQFTGVHDYFGREIWEGDILKWMHFEEERQAFVYYELFYRVGFSNGCFGTYGADEEDFTPFESDRIGDVVVGNVFADAHLLTQNLELQW